MKGKGLTDMYGVRNNSVNNFPAGYNNYGKSSPTQNPSESHTAAEKNYTGRTDQILFSAVQRKESETYSKLSDKAKSYLADLQKKYPGYAFMIADYETDEEAGRILSEGRGEINVLITPDLVEKMASDEATRSKYEAIIDGAADQFAEIKDKLTEGGKSIVDHLGLTVNGDGTTSIYAFLKQGITGEDGSRTVKSSLVGEFTDMLNALAEAREKMLEENKDDPEKPIDKEEEKKKVSRSTKKNRLHSQPRRITATCLPKALKSTVKRKTPTLPKRTTAHFRRRASKSMRKRLPRLMPKRRGYR